MELKCLSALKFYCSKFNLVDVAVRLFYKALFQSFLSNLSFKTRYRLHHIEFGLSALGFRLSLFLPQSSK